MALLLRDKILALLTQFNIEWGKVLEAPPATYKEWCTELPSKTAMNSYKWLDSLVQWRKWLGEREIQNLMARGWDVINEDYEASFGLDKNDIEDDNLGLFMPSIQNLASGGWTFLEELVLELMSNATTTKCYDGQNFADNVHPVAAGQSFDNLSDLPMTYENIWAAINHFKMGVKLPNGKILKGLKPYAIACGQSKLRTAEKYYNNKDLPSGSGEENDLKGRLKPIPNEFFTGAKANHWCVLAKDSSGLLTPFVVQMRKAPEASTTFDEKTSAFAALKSEDFTSFSWRKLLFGGHARGAVTVTFPHLLWYSDGSGS